MALMNSNGRSHMRAVEYAKMLQSQPLEHIVTLFIREYGTVALQRNIGSRQAALALLKEFDIKWAKFVELAGLKIKPDGFRIMLKEANPEFMEKLQL
jgi:hypothetical protein